MSIKQDSIKVLRVVADNLILRRLQAYSPHLRHNIFEYADVNRYAYSRALGDRGVWVKPGRYVLTSSAKSRLLPASYQGTRVDQVKREEIILQHPNGNTPYVVAINHTDVPPYKEVASFSAEGHALEFAMALSERMQNHTVKVYGFNLFGKAFAGGDLLLLVSYKNGEIVAAK